MKEFVNEIIVRMKHQNFGKDSKMFSRFFLMGSLRILGVCNTLIHGRRAILLATSFRHFNFFLISYSFSYRVL